MNVNGAVRVAAPVLFAAVVFYFAYFMYDRGLSSPPNTPFMQSVALKTDLTRAFSHSTNGGVRNAALFNQVLVLCWILTHPGNHQTKAKAVKETWAPRCNKAVFMSSQVDKDIGTIDLKLSGEGRDKLWEKSRKAWHYVYEHFVDDYDWFMKADDDCFVIVENLRYFCSRYDPNVGHYFGRVFKPFGGYMSGGAGYVVSRGALKKLGPKLAEDGLCGHAVWNVEDAKFGVCLKEVGVEIGNSLDNGKDRFHPFVPEQHLIPGIIPQKFWYRDYNLHPAVEGPDCCSDLSISFHYITPNLMHELYFYIYRLHPFGSAKMDDDLPPPRFLRGAKPADAAMTVASPTTPLAEKAKKTPTDQNQKEDEKEPMEKNRVKPQPPKEGPVVSNS